MKPSYHVGALTVLLAIFLPVNVFGVWAQANAPFTDTTADFQRFLEDILDATKQGDNQRVESLLKSTEVPNCDAWLHQMYKSDSADSWMSLCDSKTLSSKEKFMEELFAGFAKEGGEFSTRKVNDNPQGGQGGLESGMVHGGKEPLEVFFASWKLPNQPKEARGDAIGYFYFLDGGFRWDSLVSFPTPAKLIKKVEPVYPTAAASQHITGTVRVKVVIGTDGFVHKVQAVSAKGFSDNPSLVKAAEEAVMQWRYQPGTLSGRAIDTITIVDVPFIPQN